MFTGIVTDIGAILDVETRSAVRRLVVAPTTPFDDLVIGASVAHAGCCLTVVEIGAEGFAVELSEETLARTTLGRWKIGDRCNLERALKIGDELGGHLVTGHVDGVGAVIARRDVGGSRRFTLTAPPPLHRFLAEKGSVTVDGVSLTVGEVEGLRFDLTVIPHTLAVTTLSHWEEGAQVNLEIDLMARYAARWRETQ